MSHWLILLAKEPRPGVSKTRLAADLGSERAQAIAQALVHDTLAMARACRAEHTLIAYTPQDAGPWFDDAAPWATRVPQPDGSLGDRLIAAFEHAFALGARRAVAIGTDAPHIGATRIDAAFAALECADVCLGPAADGGYYAVGVNELHTCLFTDVPWSTAHVRAVTLERCRHAGLTVDLLPTERDIDDAADARSVRRLLEAQPGTAPRTAAALGSALG